MYSLLKGDYHIFRKLAYIFDYDYIESDAPSLHTKRQRYLMLKQIRESKIRLRSHRCVKKRVIIPPVNLYDTDSDSDIDIGLYN